MRRQPMPGQVHDREVAWEAMLRSAFDLESMSPPVDRSWFMNGRGAPRLAHAEQPGIAMDSDRTAGPPALDVDHVGHRYGPQIALDDVSLTVRAVSFTVLLRLDGVDKSTLFSLVTRLYAIRSGTIRILGHGIRRGAGRELSRRRVLFQSRPLDADISA